MNDNVPKPARPQELEATLLRWLMQPTPEPAAERSATPPAPASSEASANAVDVQPEVEAREGVLSQVTAPLAACDRAALSARNRHAALLKDILGDDFARFMRCVDAFALESALQILEIKTSEGTKPGI